MEKNVVTLNHLNFCYDESQDWKDTRVLDDISFAIGAGERIGLIGSNGVGKSTLLKLLVGILPAQPGQIAVCGLEMNRANLKEIRRRIGYVFQDSDSQLFMPTVYADVAFAAENYGLPKEKKCAAAPRKRWSWCICRTMPSGRCTACPAGRKNWPPLRAF